MRNVKDNSCRENQNTFYVQNYTCHVVLDTNDPDGQIQKSHYVLAYAFYIKKMGKAYPSGIHVELIAIAFLTNACIF
jgi:hypothetical protein